MNSLQITAPRKTLLRHTAVIAMTSLCALLIMAGEAQARAGTATGAHGNTATRSVTRSDGDVSSSTTGPNGNTTSRDVDRSAAGTTTTNTGPNGKTLNRSTTPTDSGSQTSVTGPNGKTGSATVTR